jgi:hypothetical protein
MSAPGILGKFTSLLFSRSLLSREDIDLDSELVDRQHELEVTVASVTSLQDDLTIEQLNKGLEELDEMIPKSHGILLENLQELQHKYRRNKQILETPLVKLHGRDKQRDTKLIIKHISEINGLETRYKEFDPEEGYSYLNYELRDFVYSLLGNKKITKAEANLFLSSIKRTDLTINYLELISAKYQVKLTLLEPNGEEYGVISNPGFLFRIAVFLEV